MSLIDAPIFFSIKQRNNSLKKQIFIQIKLHVYCVTYCTVWKEELICKIFHQSLRLFIYCYVYKWTKEYIIILWFSAIKFNINAMSKRFTDTGDNNIKQKEDDLSVSLQSLEDIFILNLHKTLFVWFIAYSTQLIRRLEEEEKMLW